MSLSQESLETINARTIVLASASPRRHEILTSLGLDFKVVTTLKPDTNDPNKYPTPEDYVLDTARMKAEEVFDRCKHDTSLPKADVVIGADTIVVLDKNVLEKPRDDAHAREMLRQLSGSEHRAMTGVCILSVGKVDRIEFVDTAHVQFKELDDETIDRYIVSKEPFDKAGAYGIQGAGSAFVKSVAGDRWTVVGLPKDRLCLELQRLKW